jgi:FkbM family methyltransferase
MSLRLKKIFPNFYKKIKLIENKIPINVEFWDKKKYRVTRKIISFFKPWKSYPRLKEETQIVYENYNGGDFIDIGAYHGFFSYLLSPKARSFDNFISCEPDITAQNDLLENLSILSKVFKETKFSLISNPISNGKEVEILETVYGHPTFLNKNDLIKNDSTKLKITSTTIDLLIKTLSLNPKFIKIDVEGAEYNVLEGMKETMNKFKPLIMLEKHPTLLPESVTLKKIDNFFIEQGYKVFKKISEEDIAINELWSHKDGDHESK